MVLKASAKRGFPSSVEVAQDGGKLDGNDKSRMIKVEEVDDDSESDEEEIPAKKARLEYEKHPVHWAPDGNVLIQISGTRFKLYRNRLVAKSLWFKDLFEAQRTGNTNPTRSQIVKQQVRSTLDSLETVDGCDLFKIEIDEINDEDMTALLDAMKDAISYMNKRPPVSKLRQIYVAAYTLKFRSYHEQVKKTLLKMFSDDPAKISSSPILDAEDAIILLGDGYAELEPIARNAYYQIARRPIRNYTGPWDDDISSLAFDETQFRSLLGIQRRLAIAWDVIEKIVEPKCSLAKCGKISARAPNTTIPLMKRHIFDPILSINKLVEQDWMAKGFCRDHSDAAITNLQNEREKIWDDIRIIVTRMTGNS